MTASPLARTRVLITGANGFIGAALARRLAADGAEVHALVSPQSTAANLAAVRAQIRVVRADLRDADATARAVKDAAPRLVYHLASHGNHPQHYQGPAADQLRTIVDVGVMGTAHLLAACLDGDVECVVNSGSAHAEYGPGTAPMHESRLPAPDTFYGAAKAAATLLVAAFGRARGIRTITLRPLYVYGPGDASSRFVPRAIAAGLSGETLPLTSRQEKKNFVFVDDVVDAYRRAGITPFEGAPVVNVGAADETALGDVIALVEQQLGAPVRCAEGTYTQLQWPSASWAADIDLARRLLGWQPATSLASGIARTVAWMTGRTPEEGAVP